MAELRRVRTGPTSYLKLSESDYAAWLAAGNVEYGEPEAKAQHAPVEDKALGGPVEKKAAPRKRAEP